MLWYGIHLSPLSKLCLLSHTDVRELPAYAFASNRVTCRVDAEFLIVYNRSLMGSDALVNETGKVFAVDHEAAPFCVVVAGGFGSEDFIERPAPLF